MECEKESAFTNLSVHLWNNNSIKFDFLFAQNKSGSVNRIKRVEHWYKIYTAAYLISDIVWAFVLRKK